MLVDCAYVPGAIVLRGECLANKRPMPVVVRPGLLVRVLVGQYAAYSHADDAIHGV